MLRLSPVTAFGADVDAMQTVPLTGYEFVRNGGFNYNLLWWSKRGAGLNNAQVEATVEPQGGPAVRIFSESVRVSVTNNYNTFSDPVSFFRIYVQGAPEWGVITLPAQFGTTEVTIPNVVDLGPNTLQHMVFIYSSSGCGAVRRYVPGYADVAAGQTVSVNLTFM